MDGVYEELDEAKAEIEKLRGQCRLKIELAENLKRAHNDELSKNKDASLKLEKLAHELNEKDDEITAVRLMCEQLKSKLTEKESIIRQISSAHDKLRLDCNEKVHKFEEENRGLVLTLDDVNAKNVDQEQQIRALKQEIEGVKRVLDIYQKKSAEGERLKEFEEENRALALALDDANAKNVDQEQQIRALKQEIEGIKRVLDLSQKKYTEGQRLKEFEEENRALALALDDANAKIDDQEQQIQALEQEIEGVKRVLDLSQKKCSESETKVVVGYKDMQGREDDFFKVEEEKRKFEDQLKWKKEQFVHLHEAHEKLRRESKMKEKEWEKERGELLDGISSLQTNLESQTRISKDLQSRLEMLNGALAHAESKRKALEIQLVESRTSLDNVCAEYDEAKLNFESLATQRDQEIAALRSSLGTKEILYKEMEYQFKRMEQEKQEMLVSLKELQEAQIRESGFSSASKLQSKLKALEQVHKGCLTNLKAKESEWCSQMEQLSEELSLCKSQLKNRENSLSELNRELEACDSLILKLELLNQETSLTLLVLKSEFSEARFRLANNHSSMNLKKKEFEENMYELVEQLEKKKAALNSVQQDLEEEREKVVILSKKMQALEELQFPLQKEVERLKEMLKESTTSQQQSEEQVLIIQSDLVKVNQALERANEELYEKFCEANEIEFELQVWKSVAEQLEANLKQNYQMRVEVEASLIAQMEVELNLKQEREILGHQLEEREKRIDDLQQKLVEVNDGMRAEEVSEYLHQIVEEKDQRICDLQQLVASLESEFESSMTSFSCKLSQMQKEIKVLRESWEKIKADEILKEVQIQEKNAMIVELENEIGSLLERVDQQEKSLLDSEKRLSENSMCLTSENKKMVNKMGMLSEKMEKLSVEDVELMQSLGRIVQALDVCRARPEDDNEQENINILASPSSTWMKKVDGGERPPLRAINS